MAKIVRVKTIQQASKYDVRIESNSLGESGKLIRRSIGSSARKAAVVSNKKIFGLYGEALIAGLEQNGFETSVHLIGDGERYKNFASLNKILEHFAKFGLTRTDAVVGLGGGVVGDISGFGACIHLRSVPFVQIPTTLLSMIDSSVGGKTGINTQFGKNLVGSFYQPRLVLIDPNVLATLPNREFTAGLCEAVKQGAISGQTIFKQTISAVSEFSKGCYSQQLQTKQFENFLGEQISFKAGIVKNDERESSRKTDAKSRKILNFGHTFAHALEKATEYKHLRHGEAVGYGIIFAAELSKKLGLLDTKVVNLLRDVVHRCGDLPSIKNVDPETVHSSFKFDKKNTGGSLQWILLKRIGKPVIIPHDQIGDALVRQTVKEIISV